MLSEIIIEASEIGAAEAPEGRMDRFKYLLDKLLPLVPGNLIEVGAGLGLTTRILCEAAKKYDRKVLVIDPFEAGWASMPVSYGQPYPFQSFYENVKHFDNLMICKNDSLHPNSFKAIEELQPVAFVFLDGLQYKETVCRELLMMAVNKAAVICVDDINRSTANSQVPAAVESFLSDKDCEHKIKYEKVETRKLIECYLYDRSNNT